MQLHNVKEENGKAHFARVFSALIAPSLVVCHAYLLLVSRIFGTSYFAFNYCTVRRTFCKLFHCLQVVPAVGHVYPMHLFATTSYCGIFNLLDFAAGTVCVSKVTEEDERMLADYPEDDLWYKMAKEATKVCMATGCFFTYSGVS